ncbi:MAG: D-alanine--D-alanine ligase [Proteobacteria bacterium]|nr:D-alanine--D-alanine ligase [Pseudomonadota bacterium]MBU1708400.1 D-alanine--D-alanine ligase [Pseudomonadota bacterium]
MKIKHIGLVYDLRSAYLAEGYSEQDVAEFDSESTIDALEQAINANGYQVSRIGHGRQLNQRLINGERWDLVFSIAEGLKGRSREAQVPALLEMYGQPYVFSDPLTCAVTLDKYVAKKIILADGLATPAAALIHSKDDLREFRLPFPVFAKPVAEGTGKGISSRSRIDTIDALHNVAGQLLEDFPGQPVLVEAYLPGREFTTGILGTGHKARILGTLEVCIKDNAPAADYSYEVKELCEDFVDYVPVVKGDSLIDAVEALALASYRSLECRDTGRVDIRLDAAGTPCFIEINPLPGLHPHHSDLPMIATAMGMNYNDLIGGIIASAFDRV